MNSVPIPIKRDVIEYRLYSGHDFEHYIKDMGIPDYLIEAHKAAWQDVDERFDSVVKEG